MADKSKFTYDENNSMENIKKVFDNHTSNFVAEN